MSDPAYEPRIEPPPSTSAASGPASVPPTVPQTISPPPTPVYQPLTQPLNQPLNPPAPPVAAWPARPRSARANAFTTLILAALTLGSLALPWAGFGGFGASSDLSLSGFDLIKIRSGSMSDLSDVTNIQLVEWLSIGVMVLSFLRMLAPGGTSGLAVLASLGLLGAVAWTDIHLFQALNDASDFPDGVKPGPVLAGIAAILCTIAACRAPGTLRADRQHQAWMEAHRSTR